MDHVSLVSPVLVAVPLALLVIGTIAATAGMWRLGVTVAAAAITWPGARLVAESGGSYAFGLITGPLWPAVTGLLCLQAVGMIRSRIGRTVLLMAMISAVAGVTRALVYQGFDDPDCHQDCVISPLLVTGNIGLARNVDATANLAALSAWVGLLALAIAAWIARARRSAGAGTVGDRRPRSRSIGLPSLVELGVVLVACISAVESVARWRSGTPEVPSSPAAALHSAAAACFAVVAVALMIERARMMRALARVRQVLAAGESVGVTSLLSAALRDPDVQVGHFVDAVGYVGRSQLPLAPVKAGRRRTELIDEGRPIAVIDHDSTVPPAILVKHIGTSMLIAIHNEGLQLRLEHEVARLAESRRRIVRRGDEERARLERDLHDGAQQGVLALSLEVSRLHARAVQLHHVQATEAAAAAAGTAQLLLERLRGIARGIHPSVLDGGGLGPALRQLADVGVPPFFLSLGDLGGLSAEAERAAYAIARDATLTPIEAMHVRIDDELVISVEGSGPAPIGVSDRAAAAGGSFVELDGRWEVRVPCA